MRTPTDLLSRLATHVYLLRDYHTRAFRDRDEAYYGEVAGKLRLLTYKSNTNRPLLIDLMDELGVTINVTLDPHDRTRALSLREYMT